jgi:hypothetical protein
MLSRIKSLVFHWLYTASLAEQIPSLVGHVNPDPDWIGGKDDHRESETSGRIFTNRRKSPETISGMTAKNGRRLRTRQLCCGLDSCGIIKAVTWLGLSAENKLLPQ